MTVTYLIDKACNLCTTKTGPFETERHNRNRKGWPCLRYEINGKSHPEVDICINCLKPGNREDAERKIGKIIMQSIESVQ